jgi:hypothetical protein
MNAPHTARHLSRPIAAIRSKHRRNVPQPGAMPVQRSGGRDGTMLRPACFDGFPRRIGAATVGRLALLLVALAGGGRASADVFEVGGGGEVVVRAGAGAVAAYGADADTSAVELAAADVAADMPDVPGPALTTIDDPAIPAMFRSALADAARRWQVSPDLLAALVWQESRWQPAALSPKGAVGLGQLMPATARALAVDPRDIGANLSGAAHYLRQMLDLFDGDVERALAAYNAGPERVLKANGIPAIPETRTYVSRIIDRLAATRAGALPGAVQ